MYQSLRKDEGSYVLTVPKAFLERNGLIEGDRVVLRVAGKMLLVEVPPRPRYKLAALLTEMPEEPPRVEGWDDMPATESETC